MRPLAQAASPAIRTINAHPIVSSIELLTCIGKFAQHARDLFSVEDDFSVEAGMI